VRRRRKGGDFNLNIFYFIKKTSGLTFELLYFFLFQYENLLLKLSMLFKKNKTNYKEVLKALPTTVF